jgi:hypothetical protein
MTLASEDFAAAARALGDGSDLLGPRRPFWRGLRAS